MDFVNHPIRRATSIIDSSNTSKHNKSIIDSYTTKFRVRFNDPTFHDGMTAKIIKNLSEADIEDLADYIDRKATTHKGRAFAKLCDNVIKHKRI